MSNGSAIIEPKQMSTFDFNCVVFSDVFYPLTKLHEGAAGPDMMPPILYKKLALSLVVPLTLLFNLILQSGVIPKHWLSAIVRPIWRRVQLLM